MPTTTAKIAEVFDKLGIQDDSLLKIIDHDSNIKGLRECMVPTDPNLDRLNYLANLITDLSSDDQKKFEALLENSEGGAETLINECLNLDKFTLYEEWPAGDIPAQNFEELKIPNQGSNANYAKYQDFMPSYVKTSHGILMETGKFEYKFDGNPDKIPQIYKVLPQLERTGIQPLKQNDNKEHSKPSFIQRNSEDFER